MTTTLDEVLDLFKQVAQAQKETDRLLREQSQETDRQLRESEQRFQKSIIENEKGFKQLRKELGNLGQSWGRFVENMVAPACETLFLDRGIPVHQVSQRVKKRLNSDTLEIDILVLNQDHALVVEVKSKLSVQDVKDFLTNLAEFRRFFPEYEQKQVYGAVAAMDIEEGADKYAYRQGLFVLTQSGESVSILNSDEFQPKNW
ncbi:slr1818 [Synechocystis sp. PCC 6803]|uniref:Slr1818 protein n=1 Tax=Synechocystis sp. (strain ATCC 27184 / PCC 6803 / Kazusa) TaxID=1111708 RepID=P73706_SYNY3|nr:MULTISPECIES: hypothetical protein [unclassified Synechocystis]BAM51504.1 hypothetical protein BEST7613_2573 [Synechocystis sp. PCC 6803] [Bacillus subtilis BEST7613]AGF51441.1 hypothetical protein MYO_111870 [Synechocystis sp. PCC 6803]ALJ67444.1 hypothetical protein AOY38_06085 [Synechocystis sp. PCC 6803]AVP89292.1 DUF3782 domain-containing protein [Synechocystis sp. IPPAS B-1465]MBD2617502.1 DUF3782 domain-containing protein [Synechocystis sp. FACHB-898]